MGVWVYMVECGDGSFYTGQSSQLPVRVAQHQREEGAGYTRLHLPVRLVWAEELPSLDEALVCEERIRKWSRAKKLALIRGDFGAIKTIHRSADQRRRERRDVGSRDPVKDPR